MRLSHKFFLAISVSTAFVLIFGLSALAQSTISGTIYDKLRTPLADIDVELLDEYYRLTRNGRQKTSSGGRYEFSGLNDGRYYVRVMAFRYDLIDETHEVVVASVTSVPGQSGASFNLEDFYLQPRKGGLRDAELSVVFAQEIPKAAGQAYKTAVEDLNKKRSDEGFAGLQKAIEIYPAYYVALQRLGTELFLRKQYLLAAQSFLKAGEVNPRSAMPFYNAGYSLFLLGDQFYKSSATCLREAFKNAPASVTVNLLLGTLERRLGNPASAEKHLVQAKKLATDKVPEIHKELAQLYDGLKKYKEAADELENYVKAAKMSDEDEAKTRKIITGLRAKS